MTTDITDLRAHTMSLIEDLAREGDVYIEACTDGDVQVSCSIHDKQVNKAGTELQVVKAKTIYRAAGILLKQVIQEIETCHEPSTCSNCAGSGEGMHDGSTCYVCKGSGVEQQGEDDE